MEWRTHYLSHHLGKPAICIGENKGTDSFAVTAKLISAFVLATRIVQFLYFLNPNFQPLTIFCDCTGWFMSDLVGTQIVGFPTHRLILKLYTLMHNKCKSSRIFLQLICPEKSNHKTVARTQDFIVLISIV